SDSRSENEAAGPASRFRLIEVPLDQRDVLVVRLPADVEEIAENGHGPDDRIDGDVGEHAQHDRARRAEPYAGEDDVSGEYRDGAIEQARKIAGAGEVRVRSWRSHDLPRCTECT